MAHQSALIAKDIDAYLREQEQKSMLRFITCGSVDDGKSTLIGRLLYEAQMIFDDHFSALQADSKKLGSQGGAIDLALLVDGLAAEREQGITIDVAYRFFSTERRKFIVADTPGHEQYTRNMATGASTAELAVLIVDARKGVLTQTKRHSFIVSMLGVKHLLLAVNKMDLVDYAQGVFNKIDQDYRAFAEEIDLPHITSIPVSALKGDNIISASAAMHWYQGPTLMQHLESVDIKGDSQADSQADNQGDNQANIQASALRLPVQWVNRPNPDFRGFSGQIASGMVRPGDEVAILPSARRSRIARVLSYDGDLEQAQAGQSVTVTLSDEIDVSRGDMIVAAESPAGLADQFQARLLWMADAPMLPGRSYLMKLPTRTVGVDIAKPRYKLNINTMQELAADTLALNEIGVCNIALDRQVPFDPYAENRATGCFILIDRITNNTVGMGLINFALRRAANIHWQAMSVEKAARASMKGQRPVILWFTGISGAGKSTIANMVEQKLHALGRHTSTLDGDNVRHGLNHDLGFTDADRVENIRRVAEVAKLMLDSGLIVIVSFISPFRSERRMARSLVETGEFIEVFVDTPLGIAEARDSKGLYKKARAGELKNFTGIDSPYEVPEAAEIHIDTSRLAAEEAADKVLSYLRERSYF